MVNEAFSLFSIASLRPLVIEHGLNNRLNNKTLWGHDYTFQDERCYVTHYSFHCIFACEYSCLSRRVGGGVQRVRTNPLWSSIMADWNTNDYNWQHQRGRFLKNRKLNTIILLPGALYSRVCSIIYLFSVKYCINSERKKNNDFRVFVNQRWNWEFIVDRQKPPTRFVI